MISKFSPHICFPEPLLSFNPENSRATDTHPLDSVYTSFML